ncbi:expressed unknown protein [Seminavis robusta]|uniref:Uncharacterized protein n=1 Tax=Seminavis robusta TaxID=568900 RepID=A0A9N8EYQ1_9STRA|nr:expressed unknown protein [Seminavis robusta]|eukprot:Sro2913_g340160.1 n/a (236) ;mRNA; f:2486-3193
MNSKASHVVDESGAVAMFHIPASSSSISNQMDLPFRPDTVDESDEEASHGVFSFTEFTPFVSYPLVFPYQDEAGGYGMNTSRSMLTSTDMSYLKSVDSALWKSSDPTSDGSSKRMKMAPPLQDAPSSCVIMYETILQNPLSFPTAANTPTTELNPKTRDEESPSSSDSSSCASSTSPSSSSSIKDTAKDTSLSKNKGSHKSYPKTKVTAIKRRRTKPHYKIDMQLLHRPTTVHGT